MKKDFQFVQVQYEPVLKNRFMVILPENTNIPSESITSIDLPKFQYEKTPKSKQDFKSWEDVKVNFMDIIDDNGETTSYKLFKLSQENLPLDLDINITDSTKIIYNWKLIGCKIKNIDFGQGQYEYPTTEQWINVIVTFSPLDCILTKV